MKNKLSKALSFIIIAVLFLGINFSLKAIAATTTAYVQIYEINGIPVTSTIPCIAGPLTLKIKGHTGNQGTDTQHHVDINWGDGVTTTLSYNTVPAMPGKNADFDLTVTHTPIAASSSLSVVLYHQGSSGNDGSANLQTFCVAPPTTAVLTVKKHVVNDNLFPGTAVASDFTIRVKNSSNVDVPNGGGSSFASPTSGSETGKDFIITPAGGAYKVSENAFVGYTGTISGDCAVDGTITIVAGNNYTCTITNNDDVIKANPTLSVTNSPVTFNGNTQSATVVGSITGVVTNIKYDGSATLPTNAGTYAVTADFTPTDTVNYNSLSNASAGNFVINKANTTTVVTCANVTYTGLAQAPCTVSVTGAGGLSLTPSPTYSNNTNAGTASASYTYAGDSNYNGSSDSKTFAINKANTTTVVTCSDVTYNGSAQTPCTVSVTGVAGLSLTPSAIYSSNTNAGTASASYTYAGDSNYNGSSDSKNFTIAKADADIVVTPYSVIYDGFSHIATGTAFGVLSENLSAFLDLSATTHTNAGTYSSDAWAFAGNTNYNTNNGTVSDSIAKADQVITFTVANHTFGDSDFTISGSASSGLPVTLTVTSGACELSGNTLHITGAGDCTVSATQSGNGNYNPAPEVDRTFSIAKANQSITFGPLTDKTFGDTDFTVSATSDSGLPVTFSASGDCTITGNLVHITGAGSCTVTASQAGDSNYNPASSIDQTFNI